MPRGSTVVRRLLGFSTLSLISAIGPMALLPVVARLGGESNWAALGVGQSVGAFLALPVLFGWSLVGPTEVARAAVEDRSALYRESLVSRSLVLVGLLPVGICLATVLAPEGSWRVAAAMAVSMMLTGLSSAWFCVGVGKPLWLALYEVLPRLAGALAALALLLSTEQIIYYPVAVGLAAVSSIALFAWRHRPGPGASWPGWKQIRHSLVHRRSAAATVAIGGAYSAAPVALASSVLAVGPLAVFVSAERIYRFALPAVVSLSDSVQGWVGEVSGRQARRRATVAVSAHFILGLSGGAFIIAFGPWVSAALFGDALAVDRATLVGFGIAFFAISVNTSLGRHVLVPLGQTGFVLASTTVGAAVGLVSLILLGHLYGAPGAAAAFALSEVAVTSVQAIAGIHVYRVARRPVAPSWPSLTPWRRDRATK